VVSHAGFLFTSSLYILGACTCRLTFSGSLTSESLVLFFLVFRAEQGSFDTFCFALNPEGGGLGWEETGWNETGRVVEGGGGGPGPHRVWRNKAKEHCSMIDLSGYVATYLVPNP